MAKAKKPAMKKPSKPAPSKPMKQGQGSGKPAKRMPNPAR